MATTYLTRTPASAGNTKTFTISVWCKKGNLTGSDRTIIGVASGSGSADCHLRFNDTIGSLQFRLSDIAPYNITTNAYFRDTSAWYHVVASVDTTQATASDRVKLYINGVEQSYSVAQYPAQDWTSNFNDTRAHEIGRNPDTSSRYYDGSMSHFHFIDGTAYDASAFGQADANGVWTIKTSPSVTYGTNGFFILKDGNSVTDQSGNGNNFTVGGGTLTNTEDSPSNVFATLNPLTNDGGGGAKTYSLGNTKVAETADSWTSAHSTLGATSGKWYFEAKVTYTNNNEAYIGASSEQAILDKVNDSHYLGQTTGSVGYYTGNGSYYKGAGAVGYGSAVSGGDIVGVALDLDNNYIYFSINGTWQNSGDPESGATGTGGISLPSGMTTSDFKFLSVSPNESYLECNFGNGYFGTTAVASAGTNASGIGIFEYDVPTGYTALSTKGLNL